jgi:hypothetical protein
LWHKDTTAEALDMEAAVAPPIVIASHVDDPLCGTLG